MIKYNGQKIGNTTNGGIEIWNWNCWALCKTECYTAVNQSINHLINQSINQSTYRSRDICSIPNQSIKWYFWGMVGWDGWRCGWDARAKCLTKGVSVRRLCMQMDEQSSENDQFESWRCLKMINSFYACAHQEYSKFALNTGVMSYLHRNINCPVFHEWWGALKYCIMQKS